MFRVFGKILIVAMGAAAGALLGLFAGAAFLESGRTACEAASCADTIVRGFAPAGAILGALLGFGKARAIGA